MAQQLTIDMTGSAGLAPKFFGDVNKLTSNPELRILANEGQMAEGVYNPFRRSGYMSPSTTGLKAIGYTGTAEVSSSLYDEIEDIVYLAEAGINIFGNATLDATDFAGYHSVTGATMTDIIIYQVNGVRKFFYTYKKASTLDDMGMAALPIASENDDFLSADTAGAFRLGANNHRMVVADNGYMYILDGNKIHKFDGTADGGANGTATEGVLELPKTFQMVDAIDYDGNLWIVVLENVTNLRSIETETSVSNRCGIYVWNRQSTVFDTLKYIPLTGLKYIKHIYISPKGDIRLMAIGANRCAQIMGFDGLTFQLVAELGVAGCPMYRDAIQIGSDMTYFLTERGEVFAHGAIFPHKTEGLYKLGSVVSTSANFHGGSMLFGGSNSSGTGGSGFRTESDGLFISYRVASTKYLKKFYINGTDTIQSVAQATAKGDVFTPVSYLPQLSTVNKITVYMATGATSGTTKAADLKIYFNQSTTPWATKAITRADCARGYIDIPVSKQYVNSIQFETEFNTSVTAGAHDFAPSMAIVDYSPTSTKG